MKTFKDYLEMNSIKQLTNVGLVDRLVDFIQKLPDRYNSLELC